MSHSIAAKKTYVNVRVDEKVKHRAETTLKKLGISMSDVVNMLLSQINLRKGIPFDVKIPNRKTRKALEETDRGIGLIECNNTDELFEQLGI